MDMTRGPLGGVPVVAIEQVAAAPLAHTRPVHRFA
jgi:hypothetical protein